jgi:HSP20 family protein
LEGIKHDRKEFEMATLVRWQPWTELAGLQNEMSRLMNGLLEGDGKSVQSWVPALDVWETENELVYAFDLPGIPEDQISLEVEDGSLTVTAQRERTNEQSGERFYRFERRHGTFTRTIGLPQGVSEDSIKADYTNGVLEVHVAKPEQAKPRRIQVGSGSQATIEGDAKKK